MPELRMDQRHTAALSEAELTAIRTLMDAAFGDRFSEQDWDHTIGGMHVMVWEGADLLAHGSVIQRQLILDERAVRCGFVEGVAVRPDQQRQGLGSLVMEEIEGIIRRAYPLGTLSASDAGYAFYVARGWLAWEGETFALTLTGLQRTPEDDGAVFVLPVAKPLDLQAAIACDWRDGDLW